MALVLVLSVLPKAAPPLGIPQSDKIAHCVAYAWLAGLAAVAWKGDGASARIWAALAMGIGLEFVQMLVPGRFFSLLDMAANVTGLALGWWLGARMAHRRAAAKSP